MKHSREFEIAWQGLKLGPHVFEYEIEDRFMHEHGAGEDMNGWGGKLTLKFDKHENFFMLHFDIDGKVVLACDRCGDDFDLKLWDEFDLVIKIMSDDAGEIEEEDDVVFISRGETVLDLSPWVYEFIMLSVPLQRIHPDNANGTPGCNAQALDLLGRLSEHVDDQPKNELWKGLDGLKIKDELSKKN